MIVDSHCHLNYLDDPGQRLAQARSQQVGAFLCIGVNEATSADVLRLADEHHDVWATIGQHPEGVDGDMQLDWIITHSQHRKIVGVGETGLDYHRLGAGDDDDRRRRWQRNAFAQQLEHAAALDLPAVVHTRAAEADTVAVMRAAPDVRGVLHCFTESWDLARTALDLGWYVSISGIVTFRNADNVRDVAARIPADRLLLETDCPWLAPEPHRGRTNEPAFVVDTARYVAGLRGVSLETLAAETTENFYRLFDRARLSVARQAGQ